MRGQVPSAAKTHISSLYSTCFGRFPSRFFFISTALTTSPPSISNFIVSSFSATSLLSILSILSSLLSIAFPNVDTLFLGSINLSSPPLVPLVLLTNKPSLLSFFIARIVTKRVVFNALPLPLSKRAACGVTIAVAPRIANDTANMFLGFGIFFVSKNVFFCVSRSRPHKISVSDLHIQHIRDIKNGDYARRARTVVISAAEQLPPRETIDRTEIFSKMRRARAIGRRSRVWSRRRRRRRQLGKKRERGTEGTSGNAEERRRRADERGRDQEERADGHGF
jgi:hypothetical protein